ncbi:hypothetical protein C8R44DRAFT_731356 [Mycena epipterygia]|nr:hypothetical protein C8R44DRAFT_731356 [Mycena epipterygia]
MVRLSFSPHNAHARLVHSTQKIEALFSETPLFVDSPCAAAFAFPVPPSPINGIKTNQNNAHPAAFIYATTLHSSSLSIRLTRHVFQDLSPIRIRTHDPYCGGTRPLVVDNNPPPHPSDFSIAPTDEAWWQRRCRMACMVSTLGENDVATELVFPGTLTPVRARTSSRLGNLNWMQRRGSKLSRMPSSQFAQSDSSAIILHPIRPLVVIILLLGYINRFLGQYVGAPCSPCFVDTLDSGWHVGHWVMGAIMKGSVETVCRGAAVKSIALY